MKSNRHNRDDNSHTSFASAFLVFMICLIKTLLRNDTLVVISASFFLLVALSSCNDTPSKDVETATTGTAEILCDESLAGFMKPAFALFDSAYPLASVKVKSVPAREAMAQLFAGKARGIIIARHYLHDEDSLTKAFKVNHAAVVLAQDALVFYAQPNFPLDTLSIEQLQAALTDKAASLPNNPVIICPDAFSSEYGNVMLLLTGGKAPLHTKFRKTHDSVYADVMANSNAIGVGYLSRLAGKANVKDVKLLRIGYTDTTGARVRPKPVHQSYVVMGKYPLTVEIRGVLLEDRQNLPWGFMQFIRNDKTTKEFFVKNGIVPQNAIFNLTPEEDE
jgi:hypothetical protein